MKKKRLKIADYKRERVFLMVSLIFLICVCAGTFLFFMQWKDTQYFDSYKQVVSYDNQAKGFNDEMDLAEIYWDCKDSDHFNWCINQFVMHHYNYTLYKGVRSIPDMLKYGADCEGWNYLYYRLLKMDSEVSDYDWDVQMVTSGNHIFTIARKDNFYCMYDQASPINCNYLSEVVD